MARFQIGDKIKVVAPISTWVGYTGTIVECFESGSTRIRLDTPDSEFVEFVGDLVHTHSDYLTLVEDVTVTKFKPVWLDEATKDLFDWLSAK